MKRAKRMKDYQYTAFVVDENRKIRHHEWFFRSESNRSARESAREYLSAQYPLIRKVTVLLESLARGKYKKVMVPEVIFHQIEGVPRPRG